MQSMIATSKWLGMLAVAFVAGSFVASPELRAYAANTVRSIDIVDRQVMTADLGASAVTAAKIKDGEVKAAEIATNGVGAPEIAADAVGASEIKGVSKLIFAECQVQVAQLEPFSEFHGSCDVPGATDNDHAIATLTEAIGCLVVSTADGGPEGKVSFVISNMCESFTFNQPVALAIKVFKP